MDSLPKGRGRGRGRGRGAPVMAHAENALPQTTNRENVYMASPICNSSTSSSPGAQPTRLSPETSSTALEKKGPTSNITLNGNRAKRPGYGTLGFKKIPLVVNMFQLRIPHGVVYQYDVDIEQEKTSPAGFKTDKKVPTRMPQHLTQRIFDQLVKSDQMFSSLIPVYDGNKTLITKRPLDIDDEKMFIVTIKEENNKCEMIERRFFVTVKPVFMKANCKAEIDLDDLHRYIADRSGALPAEAIKALDIIFKHAPAMCSTPIGRSFFIKPTAEEVPPFGGGREIWFGHTHSIRPTEWAPVINIDLSATTFYKAGPVLHMAKEILNLRDFNRSLTPHQIRTLEGELKSFKIKVTHMEFERKFRAIGLSKVSARELKFPLVENGCSQEISIEKYFYKRYNLQLKYPNLPCIQMQPKEKRVYMPMEVCVMMPDQHCKKNLSANLTAIMIKKTLKTPKERFWEIEQKAVKVKEQCRPFLKEFKIDMNTRPTEVESRVLNPPKVVYSENDKFTPKEGSWKMSDHCFLQAVSVSCWALLNYGEVRREDYNRFKDMLISDGSRVGLRMKEPVKVDDLRHERKLGVGEILTRLRQQFKELELVVIILPNFALPGSPSYNEVKQIADTQMGLVTQCVRDINISNTKKLGPQLVTNICQKINAKLGGINNSIDSGAPGEKPTLMNEPVIFMGADVTHPAPGINSMPSIASVVGSLDRHPSKFVARTLVQKTRAGVQARMEIIQDLAEMVREILKTFFRKTGHKPGRIIFYRDGVSEGQFSDVCSYEINKIKEACLSLNPEYKPALTFIVVQKRHRTRFYPKNDRDGMGRAGNVPPGTTVDTKVVSPVDFDFYLYSHYGLQGTSKPTHYTVLWDENNLSADEIQVLTYYLCFTYTRCTRSISLPIPVQYAHLAAYKARAHISRLVDDNSSLSDKSDNEYSSQLEAAVKIHETLQNSMYFI